MDTLTPLIQALGLDEGADLDAVLSALATAPPDRDTYALVRALDAALRSTAADDGTDVVALAADLERLGESGTAFAARIAAAEAVAGASALDDLPAVAEPVAEPEAAADPEAEATAEAEPEAATDPAPIAPGSAAPAVAPIDPDETIRVGLPGGVEERPLADLAAAMADGLAYPGSTRIDVPMRVDIRPAEITAAVCGDTATTGYCGFPALEDGVEVCGTTEWPEAAAFRALETQRVPGQRVLRRSAIAALGSTFSWGPEERDAQLFRDEAGELVLTPDGRPQLDPDAPQKPCEPILCGEQPLWPDVMRGACRSVDVTIDAEQLAAVRQAMLIAHVRDLARSTLSWLGGQADWVEGGTGLGELAGPATQRNAAARLISYAAAAAAAIAEAHGVSRTDVDMFAPAWLPSLLAPEGYLRPGGAPAPEWASVLSDLAALGVTPRLSIDHFVDTEADTIATQLTTAGYSTWSTPSAPSGTIAAPGTLVALPTQVPLLFAAAGEIVVDVRDYLAINMTGGLGGPNGREETLRQRRTLFIEQDILRHRRGCAPVIGVLGCLAPQGGTTASTEVDAICEPEAV